MGLLNLGKKAFGPSNWENLNWTAILNGLKNIQKISSVKLLHLLL